MHTESFESKSERINIRLEHHIKQRIEQAASADHRSLTSFIIASAEAAAEEVLKRSEAMTLSAQDWDSFMAALQNPPKANAALKRAFADYRDMPIHSDV